MLILYIILFIITLISPDKSKDIILSTTTIFFNNLYPILFSSILLLDIINNNYYYQMILLKSYKFYNKIFHFNSPLTLSLILISILLGSPSATYIILNSIKNNLISEDEGYSIIYSFSSLSISYTIYILRLNNINIFIYLSLNILFSFLLFKLNNNTNKNVIEYKPKKNKQIAIIKESIINTFKVLFTILGMCIFFSFIQSLIKFKKISPYIEIMTGLIEINNINIISTLEKNIIIISSLTFSGISIIFQIIALNQDISIIKLLKNKIIASIAITLSFFLYYFIIT